MISFSLQKRFTDFRIDATLATRTEGARLTALFGRSGCGKTSIVNMIAGLLTPDSGKIQVDGRVLFDSARGIRVPVHQRGVGYVFQEARLFPHLTVQGNLRYGAKSATPERFAFDQIVDLLDIEPLLKRRPAALSGGEKQRVAFGRAILSNPEILLMDEPLASLDGARKAEILPFIERLRDELELPIVYVSHAIEEVVRLADTMVLLDRGTVAASGSVTDITSRLDLYPLTGRYEAGSVLTATVKQHDRTYGLTLLDTPGGEITVPGLGLPVGERLRVRIRARDIALATKKPEDTSFQNLLEGVVREIETVAEPGGGDAPATMAEAVIDTGAPLRVRITRRAMDRLALQPGAKVYALIKAVAIDRHGINLRVKPPPQTG